MGVITMLSAFIWFGWNKQQLQEEAGILFAFLRTVSVFCRSQSLHFGVMQQKRKQFKCNTHASPGGGHSFPLKAQD